jgi:hypothetical protein
VPSMYEKTPTRPASIPLVIPWHACLLHFKRNTPPVQLPFPLCSPLDQVLQCLLLSQVVHEGQGEGPQPTQQRRPHRLRALTRQPLLTLTCQVRTLIHCREQRRVGQWGWGWAQAAAKG